LLRRYFGADIPSVPDRSYLPRAGRLYDYIDVTDRLVGDGRGAGDETR
jgi:hypothetical protein